MNQGASLSSLQPALGGGLESASLRNGKKVTQPVIMCGVRVLIHPVSGVLEDQIKSSLFPISQTPQSAEVTASDIWHGGSEDKNNDTLKER